MVYKYNPFTANFDDAGSGGGVGPPGPATLVLDSTTNIVLSIVADVLSAVDPGASDRILFWDDSGTRLDYLSLGTNLSITGTTINAGGGPTDLTIANSVLNTLDILSSTGTDVTLPAATTSLAGLLTGTDKTKLNGIATAATANSSDATLLNRVNHTGTQAVGTITGLGGAAILNVGTGAGTVCAGDDSRLSDPRTPTAHNQAWSTITATPTTRSGYGITDAAANGLVTASGLTQATARILGRTTGATGAVEEISVSADLTLSAGSLGVAATVVTTTGTQTLSNKTIQEVKEVEFTITDAAAFEINPANGPLQTVTLGANRTPAATTFPAGASVKLKIADGTAYAITWTTIAPVWLSQTPGASGTPPGLGTTGWTHIQMWKEGSIIYANLLGYSAT